MSYLSPRLLVIAAIYLLLIGIVALDLFSGIYKAKRRGEKITSSGLRRTAYKSARYFNILIALTFIDILQMLALFTLSIYYENAIIPILPFLTFFAAILFGWFEVKSIWEKADDKQRTKEMEAAKEIYKIVKNAKKTDFDTIINILNTNRNEEDNGSN